MKMNNTKGKTYKVTTIDSCYCLPKHLNTCIEDFKTIAETSKKPVIISRLGEDCVPKNLTTFAVIGVEARESEFYLILNYYTLLTNID